MITYDLHYYSKKVARSTDFKLTGLNNNVAVIGSTGSGKTTSIVEPTLLHAENSSYVVPVTKRMIVEKLMPQFIKKGYTVYDLNFTNPKASNIGFNPLKYLSSDRDFIRFADSVIKTNSGNTSLADSYWTESAASVLAAITSVVRSRRTEGTFKELVEAVESINIISTKEGTCTNFDELFAKEKEINPFSIASRGWDQLIKNPIKTAENIFTMVCNNLDKIATEEILALSERNDCLDIRQLANEKSVLFITTPPADKYTGNYLDIVYSLMFNELFTYSQELPDYTLPIPIGFICDDFACGSVIPDFAEHISYFRASGISVMLLLQDETQLKTIYGEHQAHTIINNCDTLIYTGGMDLATCRSISERTNKPLMDIMYMPVGQVLVMQRGKEPVMDERYPVTKDELWIEAERLYQERTNLIDYEIEFEE